MNEIAGIAKENVFIKRKTVDFQYFIQSAVEKKLAWNSLAYFLTDLAPTLDQSQEIIKLLVQELEKWVLKAENEIKNDNSVPQSQTFENHTYIYDKDDQQSLASSEMPDSEDESIENTIEIPNTPENNVQNRNSSTVEKSEESKDDVSTYGIDEKLLDKIGNQFYEFIGGIEEEENSKEDGIEEACNIAKGKSPKKLEEKLKTNTCEPKDSNEGRKDKKEFNCSYCSKVFTRKDHAANHERIHTGEKPYKCETCKKCFTRSDSLKCHERLHTGEKIHKCSSCSKSFNQKSILKRHQLIHTDERPFQCKTCEKCFIKLFNLKDHERIHNEDEKYQCENCERRFASQSNWIRHKKKHIGDKPYFCKT